jgi:hypothetical protein
MLFSSLVVNALLSCAPSRRLFQAESVYFYIFQSEVILQGCVPSDGWNIFHRKFANDLSAGASASDMTGSAYLDIQIVMFY